MTYSSSCALLDDLLVLLLEELSFPKVTSSNWFTYSLRIESIVRVADRWLLSFLYPYRRPLLFYMTCLLNILSIRSNKPSKSSI